MPKDRQQRSKRRKSVGKVDPTEGLSLLNGNAAGIDVGSAEHYVTERHVIEDALASLHILKRE
jgi:hypothetical protein